MENSESFTNKTTVIVHISFDDAFNKYIKGQVVASQYSNTPLVHQMEGYKSYYTSIEGLTFENGYTYASHGGGCSGEDCNATFIISPDNKLIASFTW